jgi:acylphosphatase
MALKRITLVIRGRVQGVFFEAAAQREARRLGLTGSVVNRQDGAMQATLEGEEESLRVMIAWARKGPTAARVDDIEVQWRAYTGRFSDFRS